MQEKKSTHLIFTGVLTAIGASLCCITPVLALVAGSSGIASTFSWLEPFRPYLIGLTVLVLGFAWYQKLKPRSDEEIQCACEEDEKQEATSRSFWQSKKFLSLVTIMTLALLFFPTYARVFFPATEKQKVNMQASTIEEAQIHILGMTCSGCEELVKHTALQMEGVLDANASYQQELANIKFDSTLVDISQILINIEQETGYQVTNTQKKQ